MKKSELKRGKPMKRTALKPKRSLKPKRKNKTALQKRVDKIDSQYWDKKCKAAVAAWAHKQRCRKCGMSEPHMALICGHHLIRKSKSRLLRWHPMNILPLCPNHHLHSIQFAAHSENVLAVVRFIVWLKTACPDQYEWLYLNQDAIRKNDMRDGPIERPDWKAQYEYWCNKLKQELTNG